MKIARLLKMLQPYLPVMIPLVAMTKDCVEYALRSTG
jgi:hypothetical protein